MFNVAGHVEAGYLQIAEHQRRANEAQPVMQSRVYAGFKALDGLLCQSASWLSPHSA